LTGLSHLVGLRFEKAWAPSKAVSCFTSYF